MMVPFRVYDREKKSLWIVLNYHPNSTGGNYLLAREDESDLDGELVLLPADNLTNYRLVDFLDEAEEFQN